MPAPKRQGKRKLQRFAISGDHPILLLILHDAEELALLRRLLQAHAYWRRRGQKVDLVAVGAPQGDEETPLAALMERLACHSGHEACLGRAGGVHLLHRQQLDEEDFLLLQTAARVVLDGSRGSLARQLAPLLRQVA
jgi:cellobiose phosphorylase